MLWFGEVTWRGTRCLCALFWWLPLLLLSSFFFFNDTATTEIYTLSLHDALPISFPSEVGSDGLNISVSVGVNRKLVRSEEHTSELQSRLHLVCRLLLEKKKKPRDIIRHPHPSAPAADAGATRLTCTTRHAMTHSL